MGAATSSKQDNRMPNIQPNHLPEVVVVEVIFAAAVLGVIAAVQNAKLSDKGNISYGAAINRSAGWSLPGDPVEALGALSFRAAAAKLERDGDEVKNVEILGDFVDLAVSGKGVYRDEQGNPTAFHHGAIALPSTTGDPASYTVQVQPGFADGYKCRFQVIKKAVLVAGSPTRGIVLVDKGLGLKV